MKSTTTSATCWSLLSASDEVLILKGWSSSIGIDDKCDEVVSLAIKKWYNNKSNIY